MIAGILLAGLVASALVNYIAIMSWRHSDGRVEYWKKECSREADSGASWKAESEKQWKDKLDWEKIAAVRKEHLDEIEETFG